MPNIKDSIMQEIHELGLSDENIELIENVIQNVNQIYQHALGDARLGQEITQAYFIIPKEGNIGLFTPQLSIPDIDQMNEEQVKEITAGAVRYIASEMNAVAIASINEAWFYSGPPTEEIKNFFKTHFVREHPDSIDVIRCTIDFNIRGQSKHLSISHKVEGEPGSPRALTKHRDWEWGKGEGRLMFEALWLAPLM